MAVTTYSLAPSGDVEIDVLDANDNVVEGLTIKAPECTLEVTTDSKETLFESVETLTPGQAVDAFYIQAPAKIVLKSKKFTVPWAEIIFAGAIQTVAQAAATIAFEPHTIVAVDGYGFKLAKKNINWATAAVLRNKRAVTFTDTGDKVGLVAHGYSNGQKLRFSDILTTTGLTENLTVYVVNKTNDDFEVSLTLGGAAIALTTNGTGQVYEVVNPDSYTTSRVYHNTVYPMSTGTTPFAVDDDVFVSYSCLAIDAKSINMGTVASRRIAIRAYMVNQTNPGQTFEVHLPKLSAMSKTTFGFVMPTDFIEATLEGTALVNETTGSFGSFMPLFL